MLPVTLSVPPAVPGRPGASVPPFLMPIEETISPVPASVPPLLTVMPVAVLLPLRTTVPEVTLTWLMPEKPKPDP